MIINKYQLFTGEIVEFNSSEEFDKITHEEQELRIRLGNRENLAIFNLREYLNHYINNTLQNKDQYKNCEIGLVYTNFERDIRKHNCFYIFVDDGLRINHKNILLEELGIEIIKEYGYRTIKYNNVKEVC